MEEYLNLAQRVQADFDNFRKRNASVRAESYEEGAEDEKEINTQVKQESRSISYWSDK